MNSEEARLQTFQSWPPNNSQAINAQDLARGGFYSTGFGMEAQCHWCKKKITDWNFDETVAERHRQLDPFCPFLNPTSFCGNVPIAAHPVNAATTTAANESINQQSRDSTPNYRDEWTRLASFKNWPNRHITPESLAKAGFYYFNESDKVRCAWCHGIIAEWEANDDAFEEHKRFFPVCPLVLFGPGIEIASGELCDIGIQQFKAPKKPLYACLSARLRTYDNWPRSDIQKPEILAQAGFYYQKIDDQVRCFHCNGGLRSWQKEDEPWFEHAKWFPQCNYVQLAKGKAYIDQVLEQKPPIRANSVQNTQECIENAMSLDDAMATEPVRIALQMGLNAGRIRNATKRSLETRGKPYDSVEELVEVVLEGQADEEDGDRAEESSSMVREVSRILDNIFNPRYPSDHNFEQSFYNDEPFSGNSNRNYGGHETGFVATAPSLIETNSTNPNSNNPNVVPDNNSHTSSTADSADSNKSAPDSVNDTTHLIKQISLEEENRKLKDARLCKICMDDECGVVFLPCGHLVACVQCAPGIDMCPMCRSPIKGFVRTFLS